MAIIGGRAHSIKQIHEVGKLGYPFAEISLYDPERIEGELEELQEVKNRYGLSYLAHYPNEGNPTDVTHLRSHFVPRNTSINFHPPGNLASECEIIGVNQSTVILYDSSARAGCCPRR